MAVIAEEVAGYGGVAHLTHHAVAIAAHLVVVDEVVVHRDLLRRRLVVQNRGDIYSGAGPVINLVVVHQCGRDVFNADGPVRNLVSRVTQRRPFQAQAGNARAVSHRQHVELRGRGLLQVKQAAVHSCRAAAGQCDAIGNPQQVVVRARRVDKKTHINGSSIVHRDHVWTITRKSARGCDVHRLLQLQGGGDVSLRWCDDLRRGLRSEGKTKHEGADSGVGWGIGRHERFPFSHSPTQAWQDNYRQAYEVARKDSVLRTRGVTREQGEIRWSRSLRQTRCTKVPRSFMGWCSSLVK